MSDDEQVQAYCANGHPITLWGGPVVARPGEQVRFWGGPLNCGQCRADGKPNVPCYGGKT